ncbi:MAG: CopD family protein [bacterium]
MKTSRRALGALLLLCAALLMRPAIAWAHAHLKKSEPATGSTLSMPPHAIRLWFSEKPDPSLTTVILSDSAGTPFATGAPSPDAEGPLAVSIPIRDVLGAGLYTVTWTTAGSDGHPSKGHFTFRITGAPAAAAPVTTPVMPHVALDTSIKAAPQDIAASAVTPAYVIARAISLAAMLAMMGAVAFRVGVLPRVPGLSATTEIATADRIATISIAIAVVYVLSAMARLYLQSRMISGGFFDADHLRTMGMATEWGSTWRPQFGAGVVACVGFVLVRGRGLPAWGVVGSVMLTLAAVTAGSGHAWSSPRMPAVAVMVDMFHIMGAAGWMGSLLWMAAVGLPIIQSSRDNRARRAAALVQAFSPLALVFAAVVGISGVASAWLRLGVLDALWSTAYGQVLLVKLVLLAALAAMGFHNWRHLSPSLGTEEGTARLQRSAAIEVGIGLLVVIVTAVLVATPTP